MDVFLNDFNVYNAMLYFQAYKIYRCIQYKTNIPMIRDDNFLLQKAYLMGAILRTSDFKVIWSLTYLHLTDLQPTFNINNTNTVLVEVNLYQNWNIDGIVFIF